ncbi:MAG: tetratricopeptide repeat protein [Candidatus Moraniibacteriota bacterium]|jgi:lipopolysaccharide export LptBFGC system permease protein LptF
MIYLIVPPIIIVIAIAILIVFLARVLSPVNKSRNNLILEDVGGQGVKNKMRKGKQFFQEKSNKATNKIKRTLVSDKNTKKTVTQGIMTGNNIKKIVSLKKKSMVSDKISDGEDRDESEIMLMKDIESDPQNSKRYEKLADYYMEHEKFEDARECYKFVLRLDPRHKRAQVAMRNLDRVL